MVSGGSLISFISFNTNIIFCCCLCLLFYYSQGIQTKTITEMAEKQCSIIVSYFCFFFFLILLVYLYFIVHIKNAFNTTKSTYKMYLYFLSTFCSPFKYLITKFYFHITFNCSNYITNKTNL